MQRTDAERQLRALRLRTPLDTVVAIIQRMRNGESLYRMYTESLPLASKVTLLKIGRLHRSGRLNFLSEFLPPLPLTEAIESAEELTEEESPPDALFKKFWATAPRYPESLRKRLNEIEPSFPKVLWNISYLEASYLPPDVALQVLMEHDALVTRIAYKHDWSYQPIHRYVTLHYIVSFYKLASFPQDAPPHNYVELAAETFAKGIIDNNRFLQSAGEGIVRYQVWRGPRYVDAYFNAQEPTRRQHALLQTICQQLDEREAARKAERFDLDQAQVALDEAISRLNESIARAQKAGYNFNDETNQQLKAELRAEWSARIQEMQARRRDVDAKSEDYHVKWEEDIARLELRKQRELEEITRLEKLEEQREHEEADNGKAPDEPRR